MSTRRTAASSICGPRTRCRRTTCPRRPATRGCPTSSSCSPELTRDFRGLRLWLPLHLHGAQTFLDALDEGIDLARMLHADLSAIAELEVAPGPDLSLVALRPRSRSDADTLRLLERVNGTGRMWLSSAPVRGRTFLRTCVLSHRTRADRLHEATQIIRDALAS